MRLPAPLPLSFMFPPSLELLVLVVLLSGGGVAGAVVGAAKPGDAIEAIGADKATPLLAIKKGKEHISTALKQTLAALR